MTLKDIAIKNLLRRKSKAGFVMAGLVVGVATVVAVFSFLEAMTGEITDKLEKYGANILVIPRTDNLTLTYGGLSLGGVSFDMQDLRQADLARVDTIKNAANIAALGPLVLGGVEVAGNRVLLAGVDFEAVAVLKPWWQAEGRMPADGELLAGAEAARIIGLNPGDRVRIGENEFTVAGILKTTGSQDDQLVFARLSTAQSLLGKEGRVSMVEVAALCNACPVEDMVRQISEVLPGARVMAIQQVVRGRMETLSQFRHFSYGVCAVVVLIGGLVVLVTMMGSVRERTSEIGIFRAIGFRRSHIIRVVFIEAAIISGLAGLIGYLAGFGSARLATALLVTDRDVPVAFSPELLAGAVLLALGVGLIASVYPAVTAARMDPGEALRSL